MSSKVVNNVRAVDVGEDALSEAAKALETGRGEIAMYAYIAHCADADPLVLVRSVDSVMIRRLTTLRESLVRGIKDFDGIDARMAAAGELILVGIDSTLAEAGETHHYSPLIEILWLDLEDRPGGLLCVPHDPKPEKAMESILDDGEPCPDGCCPGTIGLYALEAQFLHKCFDVPMPDRFARAITWYAGHGEPMFDYDAYLAERKEGTN